MATDNDARGLAAGAIGQSIQAIIGRVPEIVIAASNSPSYIKARADYVCTGANDDIIINAAINALPKLAQTIRSQVYVVGGVTGRIYLAAGKYSISNRIIIPAGSVMVFEGEGCSSWRPIDPIDGTYEGGTMIYSTEVNGRVIDVPQYTGVRADTGATNTIPATGLNLRNLELRVFNPVTTQNFYALTLDGVTTGSVENINVFSDLTVNATHRISGGVSFQAGSRSDRKFLKGMHSFGFRDYAFNLNTTHIDATQMVGGNISGGSSPCAFALTPNQNQRLENLHAFSSGTGVRNFGGAVLDIGTIMFESLTTPLAVSNPAYMTFVREAYFNSDVSWTGDIADSTKCSVWGRGTFNSGPSIKRINNFGTATVLNGQTSVIVAHNLIAAPIFADATAQGTGGTVKNVTADATNITINFASAATADTIVWWQARAS